jgi:hypothetical protein
LRQPGIAQLRGVGFGLRRACWIGSPRQKRKPDKRDQQQGAKTKHDFKSPGERLVRHFAIHRPDTVTSRLPSDNVNRRGLAKLCKLRKASREIAARPTVRGAEMARSSC